MLGEIALLFYKIRPHYGSSNPFKLNNNSAVEK